MVVLHVAIGIACVEAKLLPQPHAVNREAAAAATSKSKAMRELSSPALDLMERIYRRGVADGVFRKGIAPLHIYLSILALNYFYVSNRYTLSSFLGRDLMAADNLSPWRAWVTDVVLNAVRV